MSDPPLLPDFKYIVEAEAISNTFIQMEKLYKEKTWSDLDLMSKYRKAAGAYEKFKELINSGSVKDLNEIVYNVVPVMKIFISDMKCYNITTTYS